MLMRLHNKLFAINWVYMSILENTMSSLLCMALASLTEPYKNMRLHISWSVIVITIFLFCFWPVAY